MGMDNLAFGSQPNIANNINSSPTTNPKKPAKLTKTQSFKHQKSEGLSTPKFFRKFNFRSKSRETTPKLSKKQLSVTPERIPEYITSPTRSRTTPNKGMAEKLMSHNQMLQNRMVQNQMAQNHTSGNFIAQDYNQNPFLQASSRDVTSAVVDCKGAKLVNEYWGVSLEVPVNAIPEGVRQEIYFVISDPRLCDNAPPLDLENGINLSSIYYLI